MIRLRIPAFVALCSEQGWMHKTGRLAGSVNTRAVSRALGVNVTTVAAAYDGRPVGATFMSALKLATGRPLDELFEVTRKTGEKAAS